MTLEQCPSCDRQFIRIQDFPIIYVASVSTLNPSDIPTELPHWWDTHFTKQPTTHAFKKQIPPEVAQFFESNPDEEKLVHSDSYIYKRPYLETRSYREELERFPNRFAKAIFIGGDEYTGRFNWSPTVRGLLETSIPLRTYLAGLKQLVGSETRTNQLFPTGWERYTLTDSEMGYILPDNNELQVYLAWPSPEGTTMAEIDENKKTWGEQKRAGALWRADIGLWSDGPNLGSAGGPTIQRVVSLGQIEYEGRINQT